MQDKPAHQREETPPDAEQWLQYSNVSGLGKSKTAAPRTIKTVFESYRGVGPGFDFLRIALATLVILCHSYLIVDGNFDFLDPRLWAIFGPVLPMFFALSGFLITGSAQRLKLKDFLLNRALRIVPALAVDIFVSALVIGPIVTTLSLHDYVRGKEFHHYFLNIIGFIHFELPGVFTSNPCCSGVGQVNGSLWTVPFEIGCYALMSCLILVEAVRSRSRMLAICAGFVILYWLLPHFFARVNLEAHFSEHLLKFLDGFVSERGRSLYLYFLGGILVYMLMDKIPYSIYIAIPFAVLVMACNGGFFSLGKLSDPVLTIPTAYLAAYIGFQPVPKLPLYSRGDYSYGMYLYGFPLQQVLVWMWPGRFSIAAHFFCSMVFATVVAMVSWHLIEKPVLGLRRKFSFTARKGDEKPTRPNPYFRKPASGKD
jgi:peptidoglycan/LPS O-acetylase OafA/YrhL